MAIIDTLTTSISTRFSTFAREYTYVRGGDQIKSHLEALDLACALQILEETILHIEKGHFSLSKPLQAVATELGKRLSASDVAQNAVYQFLTQNNLSQSNLLLLSYTLALMADGCSQSTVKNYRSDIAQFFSFTGETSLSSMFTKPKVQGFLRDQQTKGLAVTSIRRKLVSITQFGIWLELEEVVSARTFAWLSELSEQFEKVSGTLITPHLEHNANINRKNDTIRLINKDKVLNWKPFVTQHTENNSFTQDRITPETLKGTSPLKNQEQRFLLKERLYNLRSGLQTRSRQYVLPYLHLMLSLILFLGMGYFGYLQIFGEVKQPLAYPTALTRPNRTLSFQGRLTDTNQNPILAATNLRFRLYDSGPSTSGGTLLWDSNTCSVTPDQDGIFAVGLGADCGAEIDANVFSENANVWLQVQVAAEILSPRQSIKSVAYALNSETLQGFPPADTTTGATNNTVLVMNNSGEVLLGQASPTLKSTSGTFSIEAQTLLLSTSTGSNGSISLDPDGTGKINLLSDVNTTGYIHAPGATLSATYAGGTALTLNAGPSATADIMRWQNSGGTTLGVIDESGNIGIGSANPAMTVDIVGTGRFSGLLTTTGISNSTTAITNTAAYTQSGTDANTFTGTSTFSNVTYSALFTGGNVGIGSATPSQKLDVVGAIRLGTAGGNNVLNTSAAGGSPTGSLYWGDRTICDSSGTCAGFANYWRLNLGTISPVNDTLDFLVGSNATESAKFAVLNVNNGTPVASISSGVSGNSMFMTADGTLSTTRRQTLTIGNSATYNTTGNVVINSNGVGNVGIGTTLPLSKLDIRASSTEDIARFYDGGGNIRTTITNDGYLDLSDTDLPATFNLVLRINDAVTGIAEVGGCPTCLGNGFIRVGPSGRSLANFVTDDGANSLFSGGVENENYRRFAILGSGDFQIGDGTSAWDTYSGRNTGGGMKISTTITSATTLMLKETSSQTADLFQVQSSSGSDGDFFVVDGAGNVGVADSTPSYKLDVNGTGRFVGAVDLDSDLELNSTLTDVNGSVGVSGQILSSTATGVDWIDLPAGSENYWRINLGAISPVNDTLDLFVGSNATESAKFAILNVNNGTPTASISSGVSGNSMFMTADGSLSTTRRSSLTIGNSSTYDTTGNVLIQSNGTGNVGIGNTNPLVKLHISGGDIAAFGTNTTLALGDSLAAGDYGYLTWNTASDYISLGTQTGGAILNVTEGANVGIGTVSPGSKLDINGFISAPGATLSAKYAGGTALTLKAGPSATANILSWQTSNGTVKGVIDETGNVGIGTSNPVSAALHITIGTDASSTLSSNGDVLITDNDSFGFAGIDLMGNYTNGGGIISFNDNAASVGEIRYAHADNSLRFKANSTEYLTVLSNGNFGVGDTTPTYRLDVNGTGRFTGALKLDSTLLDVNSEAGSSGQVLSSTATGIDWIDLPAATAQYWRLNLGTISPVNDTLDLFVGSNATASAKFAVLNVNNGTPTASVSSGVSGNSMFMTADGSLSTTRRSSLTIGNSSTYDTTGNILINPNGTGYVGIGTTAINNDYAFNIYGGTSSDFSRLINIIQTNDSNEETTGINFTSTVNKGTIASQLTDRGIYVSITPTGTVSGTDNNYIIYGNTTLIDLSSVALTNTASGNSSDTFGNYTYINGSIDMDNVSGGASAVSTIGTYGLVGITPSLVNVGNGSSMNTKAGYFSNVSSSAGHANLTSIGYGIEVNSSGNYTTTGNTTHYGASITTSGTADTNYGLYVTSSGATTNYGVYSNAGTNYFADNVGIGSTSPSQKLDVVGAIRLGTAGAGNILNTSAGAAPTGSLYWGDRTICDSSNNCTGVNYWRLNLGTVSPVNDTLDLLVGSNATASAKFAILNIDSGTPTASISSGVSGTSMFMTADGTLATQNRMGLTIGNSSTYNTTGNVLINPNGTGNVGIGTTNAESKLNIVGSSDVPHLIIQGHSSQTNASPLISLKDSGGLSVLSITSDDGSNAFMGLSAGVNNIIGTYPTGLNNTFIGAAAGYGNTSGQSNTSLGASAMSSGTTGDYNTVMGAQTFKANTTGGTNTVIGAYAGSANIASGNISGNTMVGMYAGYNLIAGANNNVLFGLSAGQNISTGDRNIIIGYEIDAPSAAGSDQLSIGNLIYGTGVNGSGTTIATGNIGIGDSSPTYKLDVNGTGRFTGAVDLDADLELNGTLTDINSSVGSSGQVLSSTASGVDWIDLPSAGSNWRLNLGTISPNNDTLDMLVGSNATASSKFAILNVNNGTPIASVSSGVSGTSMFMTADGTLSTQNRMSLSIGNSSTYDTTGNVLINSNGTGNVGIGTTGPASRLDVDTGSNTLGLRLRGIAETAEIADIFVNANGALIFDTTAGTDVAALIDFRPEDNEYGLVLRESDGTGLTTFANFYVTDAADDYLSINLNGATNTDALVIAASNNIGIGSSAPSQKLDVAGAIRLGTAGAGNILNTSAGASPTGNLFWGDRTVCDSSGSCGSGLANYWRLNDGTISTVNDTLDLLVGSNATASAKFAVLNVNSGTPTASVSSGVDGTSMFMTADGTLSTTRRQGLIIGNSSTYNTTGNLLINPNGIGNVGIGTTAVGSDYLFDILANSTADNSRLLNLTQSNNSTEDSYGIFLTQNPSYGTVSNVNIQQLGINTSLAPSATLDTINAVLTSYASKNTVSLSGLTLGESDDNGEITAYGSYNDVTGTPTINNVSTGTQNIYGVGVFGRVILTPTLTAVPSTTMFETSGGVFTNSSISSGNANVYGDAYGIKVTNSADISTTGVTTKYGGSFVLTGSADVGYGVYINSSGATTNWGVYSNSGNNYFSGNTGIGTTAPGSLLDVAGFISAPGATFSAKYAGGTALTLKAGPTATADIMQWQNSAGSVLGVINSAGNLGIGTSTASNFALEIAGSIGPTVDDNYDLGSDTKRWRDVYIGPDSLHIGTSTTDEGLLSYNSTLNIFNIGTDATTNADIAFFTDDLFLDKSSGFVGIGTTIPGYALDVVKDQNAYTRITVQNATVGTGAVANLNAFADGSAVSLDAYNSGMTPSGGVKAAGAGLYASGAGGLSIMAANATSGEVRFYTDGYADANQRMIIANDGNVGIGTTGALSELHVNGPQFRWTEGTADIGLLITGAAGYAHIRAGLASDFSNYENLILNAGTGGNVGIGTTVPLALLDVAGTASVSGTLTVGDNATSAIIRPAAGRNLTFQRKSATNTWTDTVTLQNGTGYVGIGTSVPLSILHLGSGGGSAARLRIEGNEDYHIGMKNGAGGTYAWMGVTTTGSYQFSTAGGAALVTFMQAGNAGIGTTAPVALLHVAGTASASGSLSVGDNTTSIIRPSAGGNLTFQRKSAVNTWADAVTLQNGTGFLGIGTVNPGQELEVNGDIRLDANGTATAFGLCHSGATSNTTFADRDIVACSGAPNDIAEFFPGTTDVNPGDVLTLVKDPSVGFRVVKSTQPYDQNVIGVVSTIPTGPNGHVLGESTIPAHENPQAVGLLGRVAMKVSLENGPIEPNDWLTTSSTPGVAMKATKAGRVIGRALEAYDGSVAVSPGTRSQEYHRQQLNITVGANPQDPPPGVGKVLVMADLSYYDPAIKLVQNGDLQIVGDTNNYQVTATNGSVIENILGASKAAIANITAGLVTTKELVVQQSATIADLSVTSLKVSGQNFNDYIKTIIQQELQTTSLPAGSLAEDFTTDSLTVNDDATISGVLAATSIKTETITSEISALGSLLAETATISGDLVVENNASIAGTLIAENVHAQSSRFQTLEARMAELENIKAQTAEIVDATVSGTLYADSIYNFDEKVAESFKKPSLLDLLTQPNANPVEAASPASIYEPIENAGYQSVNPDLIATDSAILSLNETDVVLGASALFVEKYLEVNGHAYVAQSLGIGDTLKIGNALTITNGTIDYHPAGVDSPILALQSSGKGKLDFLAGAMTIESGQVAITGDLNVAGVIKANTLLTNLVQPADFGNPFQVQVAGASTESGEIKKSRFEIINETGEAVATFDADGNASFQGGVSVGNQNLTTEDASDNTVSTEKSSGQAKLASGKAELKIQTPKATPNSLIYVTPKGSTSNKVLYIKGQGEGEFTVGFDEAIGTDVEFNWWIVN